MSSWPKPGPTSVDGDNAGRKRIRRPPGRIPVVLYYVDTSAFFKLVVEEEHSDAFRAWAEDHDGKLFGSDLLRVEAFRTARRHSPEVLQEVRRRLDVVTIVRVTRDVYERAAHLDPQILRTLDGLHLAVALAVGDELAGLVTYDERMVHAARVHGVEVFGPS